MQKYTLLGVLFILLGVLFFCYPDLYEQSLNLRADHLLKELHSTDSNSLSPLYHFMQSHNFTLIQTQESIPDVWSTSQAPISPISDFSFDDPIGLIEIPSINLRMPLYLGASPDHLSNGAAILPQGSLPIGGIGTNCLIAGHRGWMGSPYFQHIDKLSPGSEILLTTSFDSLCYRVTNTKIIDPSDTEILKVVPGRDRLTLITCHPYRIGGGSERYLVFCERAQNKLPQQSSSHSLPLSLKIVFQKEAYLTPSGHFSLQRTIHYYRSLTNLEALLRIVCPILSLILGLTLLVNHRKS